MDQLQKRREYYQKNKNRINQLRKQWREDNKEKIKKQKKEWYNKDDNQSKKKQHDKEYYRLNKEKIKQRVIQYRQKNKDKRNKQEVKRRNENLSVHILTVLRGRFRQVLKGANKAFTTKELLGCDLPTFIKHLENQFAEGMTWKNYGLYGWHIDHIRPCASFDLTKPEDQVKCFHYTNLQPLWAKDNLIKGSN